MLQIKTKNMLSELNFNDLLIKMPYLEINHFDSDYVDGGGHKRYYNGEVDFKFNEYHLILNIDAVNYINTKYKNPENEVQVVNLSVFDLEYELSEEQKTKIEVIIKQNITFRH